jgi:hypothetical protein
VKANAAGSSAVEANLSAFRGHPNIEIRWHSNSVATLSFLSVRGLFANSAQFDIAIRKLLPELQPGSQRLHENPIFSFRVSVYFNDVAFAVVFSSEVVSHQNHHRSPQQPPN